MLVSEVTNEEIALAKEVRAYRCREVLDRADSSLIILTLDIPGKVQLTPLSRLSFSEGVGRVYDALGRAKLGLSDMPATGAEAYLAYDLDAKTLREAATRIEDKDPLGQSLYFEVMDADGNIVERKAPRRCIICGKAEGECSCPSDADTLLPYYIGAMMSFAAPHIADIAKGILNRYYSSSEIEVIRPYFEDFILCGASRKEKSVDELHEIIADCEKAAKEANVTGAKEIIAPFALFLCALGFTLTDGGDISEREAQIAQGDGAFGALLKMTRKSKAAADRLFVALAELEKSVEKIIK